MSENNTSRAQLCPSCRKLINSSVARCPHCGLRSPGSRWKNTLLFTGAGGGQQIVSALIAINAFMFVLSLVIDFRPSSFNFSPMAFLSPSNQSLFTLGATGTIPLFQLDRWWSLVTAGYLHGGLLHIVFNMLALRQLAPLVIQEYGLNRMVVLYTVSSIGGFFISSLAGVPFTLGASAAVCGLIGALLYYGKSRGGVYGQNLFSQIGGWALGIAVFGFVVPGINNWAHGGGMLTGALLGYLLGYRERKKETFNHKVLAMGCTAITLLALVWSCLIGVLFLFFRQ
ncbi:MAG: protease [Desulfobulbaceae bacterium BRH_c16a]|nr:MAG: protease [Desulfobulbaceae bacterium BRH_c16a]